MPPRDRHPPASLSPTSLPRAPRGAAPGTDIDALLEVVVTSCDPSAADDVLGLGFGMRLAELRDRLVATERRARLFAPLHGRPVDPRTAELRREARRLDERLGRLVAEIAERLDDAWERSDASVSEADASWLRSHVPVSRSEQARALAAELEEVIVALERAPGGRGHPGER